MRIAFPFTLTILALFSSVPSFSQFRAGDSIVYLNYDKTRDMLNEPLACQSYTVIDNRMDSTPFISTIISDKETPLKLRFETDPATAIEKYISRITSDMPHGGNKDLIISLRRYIMVGRKSFYFTADAYQLEPDQHYIKVCTIDTAFEKHAADFVAGKAIALLIEKFNLSTDTVTKSSAHRWTLQEIQENKVYKNWNKAPSIHETNAYTDIYQDAIRMKNDELEKMGIQLTIRNNTFYMHLPEGYPNFFSYILYWKAYTTRSNASSASNFKDLINNLATKSATDPILKQGAQAKGYRDSYLDIEKSILVYY